ncbi:putative Cilia- and flagella-associated protein 65 [Blattamonas nauphoetae]|uniref:Cilia- and flagella-associated protein 65 n=1 Tax=Blattamonas nauphoetae TaxID=2049346 RepID=A0ABQ9XX91_9EUKA|nr:putative Cilia- and flagella-associated protein 65 [Blattamonas nauphoetae]
MAKNPGKAYGFDCGTEIRFSGWKPGGQYTRTMTMRNTSTTTQRIEYVPPKNPLFFLPFPSPMILPAGMSSSVEILFRPIELVPCEEQISFKCVKGTFSIPLIATVPQLSLSLPEQLDFGLCPINEVSLIDFEVYNNGQIDTEFSFKIPESSPLLTLSLMKGVIHAGKSIIVTAKYTPTDATVLQCLVSCICQDQVRVMSVTAQGKFPFVKASQTEISFGETIVGCQPSMIFHITNCSAVFTTYQIIPEDPDRSNHAMFQFSPSQGRIEANESIRIRVSLNAETHNVKYCDLFRICTPGGNNIQLTCTAHTVGPTVVTDKTVLNFGSLEIGTTTSQTFLITNMTDAQAEFQILADETGFFNINCVQAILPACSAANNFKTITVTFHPLVCMNYHKRLIILVKDQNPLSIELLGTGFTEQSHPAPFYTRYLVEYTQRVQNTPNMSELEALEEIEEEEALTKERGESRTTANRSVEFLPSLQIDGVDETLSMTGFSQRGRQTTGTVKTATGVRTTIHTNFGIWQELFDDNNSPTRPVGISPSLISFQQPDETSEGQLVTIRNNTNQRMTCVWNSYTQSPTGKLPKCAQNSPFIVTPNTSDCDAHSTTSFRIKFLSLPTEGYINQKLECMCYLKYLRSYTLSTGRTKIPPWCLTVSCIGRRIKYSDFIPVAKLEPESLYFPPTIPRRSTYHTIKFTNEGDTTLLFDTRGNQNGSFLVSPTSACIPPNSFCLLAVSFQPSILRSNPPLKGNAQFNPQPFKEIETMGGPTRYKVHRPPEENTFDLILKANASIGETYSSLLVGVVNHPGLCFENDHVVMRAACIGSYSKRQIKLRNPSRMSICVCVGLYQGESDAIRIEPSSFFIDGNEEATLSVVFTPSTIGQQTFKFLFVAEQAQSELEVCKDEGYMGEKIASPEMQLQLQLLEERMERYINQDETTSNNHLAVSPPSSSGPMPRSGLDSFDAESVCAELCVVGEGIRGEIRFEPAEVDYGIQMTGSSTEKTIVLINDSSADINYKLNVTWHAEASTADELDDHDRHIAGEAPPILRVEPDRGIIPARSHDRIRVFFRPALRTLYTCSIKCELDREGVFMQMQSVNSNKPDEMSINNPVCIASGLGILPSIAIVDAYKPNAPKSNVWQELSLDMLNSAFGRELTPADEKFNAYDGLLYTEEGLTLLRQLLHIPFFLGSSPINQKSSRVFLRIQNNGRLPMDWRIRDPSNFDVRADHWVEERELATPQSLFSQDMTTIVGSTGGGTASRQAEMTGGGDNSGDGGSGSRKGEAQTAVTIEPMEGHLNVGEEGVVCFTCQHSSVGVHTANFIWQLLGGGKQIVLQIVGVTVRADEPFITFQNGTPNCNLGKLIVGDENPPVHSLVLHNTAYGGTDFHMDTRQIERLNASHYEFPVFEASHSRGFMDGNTKTVIKWRFRPLEEDVLSMRIPFTIGQELNGIYTNLTAQAFIPTEDRVPYPLNNKNSKPAPLAPLPGVKCVASHEFLTFGSLPTHSVERRMLTLLNVWHSPLRFQWEIDDTIDKWNELSVHPPRGIIEAGQSRVCVVVLRAGHVPTTLSTLLKCHIYPGSSAPIVDQLDTPQYQGRQLQKHRTSASPRQLKPNSPFSAERGTSAGRAGGVEMRGRLNSPRTPKQYGKDPSDLESVRTIESQRTLTSSNHGGPRQPRIAQQKPARQSVVERMTISRGIQIASHLEEKKGVIMKRRYEDEIFLNALNESPEEIQKDIGPFALRSAVPLEEANSTVRSAFELANQAIDRKNQLMTTQMTTSHRPLYTALLSTKDDNINDMRMKGMTRGWSNNMTQSQGQTALHPHGSQRGQTRIVSSGRMDIEGIPEEGTGDGWDSSELPYSETVLQKLFVEVSYNTITLSSFIRLHRSHKQFLIDSNAPASFKSQPFVPAAQLRDALTQHNVVEATIGLLTGFTSDTVSIKNAFSHLSLKKPCHFSAFASSKLFTKQTPQLIPLKLQQPPTVVSGDDSTDVVNTSLLNCDSYTLKSISSEIVENVIRNVIAKHIHTESSTVPN